MQNGSSVTEREEAADRSDAPGGLLEKILYGAFVAAVMLIVLVSGALLTTANIFPGPQVARAPSGASRCTIPHARRTG